MCESEQRGRESNCLSPESTGPWKTGPGKRDSPAQGRPILEFHYVIPMAGVHPGYLGRLLRRLEATGFVPGRRLYGLAYEARHAVHSLTVALHYDACDRHPTEPEQDWQI